MNGARHRVTGGTYFLSGAALAAASEGLIVLFTDVSGIKDLPAAKNAGE